MPRPSSNPDKARQGGGGVEPGNYEVTKASFRNVKSDYKATQPTLVLECHTLDKDGDQIRGAEPIEVYFGLGTKALEAFHPGDARNADDADPKDLGDAADAEGNTLYARSAEDQVNASCAYNVFNHSLAKAGFPKSVLDATFAPSYVGLKFALDTKEPAAINEQFGMRLNTRPPAPRPGETEAGKITYKVATKWLNPQYLTNGAGGGKKEKAAAKEPVGTMEDRVKAILVKLSERKKQMKTHQQLIGFFTNDWSKHENPKELTAAQAYIKNEQWVEDAVSEMGGTYIDGVTTFSEA